MRKHITSTTHPGDIKEVPVEISIVEAEAVNTVEENTSIMEKSTQLNTPLEKSSM
jgi:hypothetical protein